MDDTDASSVADLVQLGEVLVGEGEPRAGDVLAQVRHDEVPGMSRMFGERCSSQARATDIGVASSRRLPPRGPRTAAG